MDAPSYLARPRPATAPGVSEEVYEKRDFSLLVGWVSGVRAAQPTFSDG